jgi:outer membrane receptor for ferrienterochelin and colicins
MRGFLCLSMFLISCTAVLAQDIGTISGVVFSDNGNPLKGAQITIRQSKLGAVAGDDGHFEIKDVPVGYRQVIASMTGYSSAYKTVFVAARKDTKVELTLKQVAIEMPGIEVEDSIPRVSVTATIVPIELKKVPAAVEIITAETLQEMGAMTVADAMMEARSTYLQGDEDRGISASLRGLRSNQTLVMINGRRIAAGIRDNVNLDDLPAAMIERIEIVRGPSSALYGSDAMGGVVNIITRKPTEDLVVGLSMRYGQSKYGESSNPFIKGYMSERAGKLGYSLYASFDREASFDRYKETSWTDGDNKNMRSGGAEFSIDLTGRQLIQGGFERSVVKRKGIRPYFWGDGRRIDDNDRKSLFMEYNYVVPERAEWLVRGNYNKFNTGVAVYPEIYGDDFNPYTLTDSDYRLYQNLYQFETRFSYTFSDGNHLTFGAESRQEKREDNKQDYDVDNNALFIQDVLQPFDQLLFVLGARYDDHSQFGGTFSPKASATLSVLENLRLKTSFGRGVRAPSIYELHFDSPTKESLIRANPNLQEETSNSWEVGMEGSISRFSGDVRFFRNDITDMITPVNIGFDSLSVGFTGSSLGIPWIRPLLELRNIEKAMSQGFELGATLNITDWLTFTDDLTLVETKDKTTDRRLLNKPDLLNTAVLRFEKKDWNLKAGVRLSSVGTRIITENYKADGYSLVHLFFSKRFGEQFELFGGVNNLLNNDPNIFGYLEGSGSPGTYFFMGLTLELWDHDKRW